MLIKLVQAYFSLLKLAMVLCLAGMVVLVFGNVVLRYAFNSGITVSEEVARLFFLYLTFLGGIVAMREHLHLGVDSVIKRLPRLGRRICLVVGNGLMLFALVLLLQGSWAQASINLAVKMPVTGISMAVFYAVGVIFSLSVGVIVMRDLWLALIGKVCEVSVAAGSDADGAPHGPSAPDRTQAVAGQPDTGAVRALNA